MFIDFREGDKKAVIEALSVTKNGTYTPSEGIDGYAPVEVQVPQQGGGSLDLTGTGWETEPTFPVDVAKLSTLNEDIEYTRTKFSEWDPNVASLSGKYQSDGKLIYAPKIDTSRVTDMSMAFLSSSLVSVPKLDTSAVENMNGCFGYCTGLKEIPKLDTSAVTNMRMCFLNCANLVSIPALDASLVQNTERIIDNCDRLTDLGGFVGLKVSTDLSYPSGLTKQSLLNVIAGLAIVTDNPTLTIGQTNLAKLTPEEIAVGTAKGWQIVA